MADKEQVDVGRFGLDAAFAEVEGVDLTIKFKGDTKQGGVLLPSSEIPPTIEGMLISPPSFIGVSPGPSVKGNTEEKLFPPSV